MLYCFSEYEFDSSRHELSRSGEVLDVDLKALEVLEFLIEQRDRVVERSEIMGEVWSGVAVGDHSISQALYVLRRALDDDARSPRFIQTLRGRGIQFIGCLRRTRPRFVGRVAELDEVVGVADRARQGRGSCSVFVGPAGIGKSALLEHSCLRVSADVLVLRASCEEEDGSPPLSAWSQLLQEAMPFAGEASFETMVEACPELGRLVGKSPPAGCARLGRSSRRAAMREALSGFFRRLAASRPVLIVVDDIHRADEWSLRALRHLVRSLVGFGFGVVATSRPPAACVEVAIARQLEELLLDARVERRDLQGLTEAEVGSLISGLPGPFASHERARCLKELTAGNPFLLLQVMEQPDPRTYGLGREARAGVLHHARQLSSLVLECLEDAAILGRRFSIRDVAAISGAATEAVDCHVRCAEAVGLVRPCGPDWEFEHIVVRDVLADEMAPARAAGRHVRAASLLRRTGGRFSEVAPRVAYHLLRAATSDRSLVDEAVQHAVASARMCIELLAFEDARRICEQAMSVVEVLSLDAGLASELLMAAGEAQMRSGCRKEGRDSILLAWRLARDAGTASRVAEAALALTPGFFALETGVVDPVAVSLLEESARGDLDDPELEADLRHRLAVALVWGASLSRRADLISEASRRISKDSTSGARERLEASRIVALWAGSNLEDRLQRSSSLASQASDVEIGLMARVFHASALHEATRSDEARIQATQFGPLAQHHRVPQALWYADVLKGMFALDEGQLGVVEEAATRIAQFGEENEDANIEHSVALFGAAVAWWRGDLRVWLETIEAIVRRYPAVEAWRVARALALADAGRTSEAQMETRALLRDGIFPPSPLEVAGLTVLSHACYEVGVAEGAERLYERLAPLRGRMAVGGYGVFTWGAVEGGLGKLALALGDLERAEADLCSSIETLERARATAWLADSAAALATCLIRRGRSRDRRRITSLLGRATEVAKSRGLARVLVAVDRVEVR